MQKKFITITTGNCDSDFYLVCHAACDERCNATLDSNIYRGLKVGGASR